MWLGLTKLELNEVVDFLKNADRFTAVGKIPKVCCWWGHRELVKHCCAVAGEASVPFFSISGSEFVEMFVGVGASRVRDLFEQARQMLPVLCSSIDAVGRQRVLAGGNDERSKHSTSC